ncbi:MAG TPA: pilin [Candidatus Limnocylindria bacterium]|nr:pilin [Candidatus Limnocylindria bacterium]
MGTLVHLPLSLLADASAASNVMRSYITPAVATICGLASLACVFFLVNGGIHYITSSGDPLKLEQAKKIIKNALVGLTLVLAAATLTGILNHAYTSSNTTPTEKFPVLKSIEPADDGVDIWDVFINAVVGFLRNIVETVAEPFLKGLSYFLNSTPLVGNNSSVYDLWKAVARITSVLFILVVGLLGFHIMSASTFGLEEIEVKQLWPQLALIFILLNTSIFAIDAVISLSNAMIRALQSSFPSTDVWLVLANITKQSSDLGVAGLLVMVALLVLSVMLLVYYILRLVTLYIGAILSPLVVLLWLIPAFRDFALAALKTYLVTIFVLFVHVVILLLAASIFTGSIQADTSGQPNTLMALLVGLATIVALLKTQGVMQELSYAASGPRAARELSGSFISGVSHLKQSARTTKQVTKKAVNGGKKVKNQARKLMSSDKKSGSPKKDKNDQGKRASGGGASASSKPLKTGEVRPATRPKKETK